MNRCIICGAYVESANSDYCNHCEPRQGYEVDILKKALVKATDTCDEWADKYLELEKQHQDKAEQDADLQQLYSHLGVEAFGKDIQEQAVKEIDRLQEQLAENKKKIEELKGERLQFYNDAVRRTQVINGVHFDIEQLLVFSEYVENQKMVISIKNKEIAEKEKELSLARNEINTLKHNLNVSQEHDNVMCEQYFEKCKETNQNKIDFAVERLEFIKTQCEFIISFADDEQEERLLNIIDSQIAELKGGAE